MDPAVNSLPLGSGPLPGLGPPPVFGPPPGFSPPPGFDPPVGHNVPPGFSVDRPPYEPNEDDDDSNAPIPDQFELTDFLDVEDLERYAPGGFHPVRLGDTFNHRYKVIHKLGSGGFATIWLARDQLDSRYVALKIIAADASDNYRDLSWVNERLRSDNSTRDGPGAFFTAALDSFRLQGPNGHHLCEVMPVLGPSMTRLSGYDCRLRPWAARRMGLQIAQALALLHSQGLCHGDLTSGNIVTRLSNLDQLSENEVLELIGAPETAPIVKHSGEPPGPSAPDYVVNLADLTRVQPQEPICIIDFDQSFSIGEPPNEMLGTIKKYLAPEAIYELRPGPKSDIWALACTLFRMRAGFDLFHDILSDSPAQAMGLVADALGPFPERWANVKFDKYGWPMTDKTPHKETKQAMPLEFGEGGIPLLDIIVDIWDELPYYSNNGVKQKSEKSGSGLLWRPPGPSDGYVWGLVRSKGYEHLFTHISREEAECFHDLLRKMFTYEPDQRISAEKVSEHPWFQWSDS